MYEKHHNISLVLIMDESSRRPQYRDKTIFKHKPAAAANR